jgi:phosphate transport system permease protein
MNQLRTWFRSGAPWIWLNAAAVSASLLLVLGLLALIGVRGLGHFWPATVHQLTYQLPGGEREVVAGQLRESETISAQRLRESGAWDAGTEDRVARFLFKTGNRDITGQDFRWLLQPAIQQRAAPTDLVVLERTEWGVFFGRIVAISEGGERVAGSGEWEDLQQRLARAAELRDQIRDLEKGAIGSVNYRLERLRLRERRLELDQVREPDALAGLQAERKLLDEEYRVLEEGLTSLIGQIQRDSVVMRTAGGREVELPLETILDAYRPNAMGLGSKLRHYLAKAWQFIVEEPREANTEGGIFPAIYGTVLMVLLMSILVTPFGVIAAVYLKEYARQGFLTRAIRIAVNNLAGVPSIVYGVFGLGFFIYTLGGSIDQLFFREALPSPTFGTGGLFWASLTLALLTLPVVIVSTEEGLARIPRAIREGSLALGATRWETLWRTVLPMASPGIMTGLILAVARAAGEVAPLMLVGVVKLAPSLPLDGNYPFLHPERKFMHLGFHIYDVGFQSPNVEAARPLVYATALLLVVVTVLLNLVAIRVRNQLREKYSGLET